MLDWPTNEAPTGPTTAEIHSANPQKTRMKKLLAIIVLGFGASSLYAQPTVGYPDFEPFASATGMGVGTGTAYAVGANLAGQTNAQGLGWYAAGSAAGQPVIASGTLTIPGLLPNPGNSVSYGPTASGAGTSARMDVGTNTGKFFPSTVAGPVYYSMAFKLTALASLPTTAVFVAGFNNSAGSQTSQPSTVGARLYLRSISGSPTTYNMGVSVGGAVPTYEPTPFTVGTTYFIVASYNYSGNPGTNGDTASLWVNPSSTTFGSSTAPAADVTCPAGANMSTSTAQNDSISSFLLREANTTEPDMIVDEVSVGLAWADVTPIVKVTPGFSGLAASQSVFAGATGVTVGGKLSAAGPYYPTMGEMVVVTINGISQTNTFNDSTGDFSFTYTNGLSALPASGTPYPITYSFAGDTPLNAASDTNTTLTVNSSTATPGFSNLTANSTEAYGTATVTLGGALSAAGPVYPAMGEAVAVAINGNVQTTTISDSTGDFSIGYTNKLSTLPASGTPYPVTYSYAGDSSLSAISNTTATLTVTSLPVSLAGTRSYDGTASAAAAILTVTNAINGDDVNVSTGGGSAALAGAGVGSESITAFTGLTLEGVTASNYTLTGASGAVTITNPFNQFSISTAALDSTGTNLVVSWASVPGVSYTVLTNASLAATGWVSAGSTNATATTTSFTLSGVVLSNANMFVQVQQ